PDQSPTYTTPSTIVGVAVTVSLALKNQICCRSSAVGGVISVGHGSANGRCAFWPHIGQSQRPIGFAGASGALADAGTGTPASTTAEDRKSTRLNSSHV